ncbi:MAG: pyrroloquinoline quinone biosynthesis peptide chaperone PqqD [Gammaproteobacteria bacterium]|jgi:pyrroloquinoline quinone biosynthesis protein D
MTHTLSPGSIPSLAPTFRFQWEEAQDCYVILYPEGMVKLSASAGEIMRRCDGSHTVAKIIESLGETFPGADLAGDVTKFLEVAYGNGWLKDKPDG